MINLTYGYRDRYHWATLIVSAWLGLLDEMITIATLGLACSSFQFRWVCKRELAKCQRHVEQKAQVSAFRKMFSELP